MDTRARRRSARLLTAERHLELDQGDPGGGLGLDETDDVPLLVEPQVACPEQSRFGRARERDEERAREFTARMQPPGAAPLARDRCLLYCRARHREVELAGEDRARVAGHDRSVGGP